MIALTIDSVDGFVAKLQRKGINVRWNGWDMIFFRENKGALRNPAGRRLGSLWGFETVVSANSQGQWLVQNGLTRVNNG